jgi:hypothetical protein
MQQVGNEYFTRNSLKPELGLINNYKLNSYIMRNRVIFVITERTCSRCVENLSNIFIRTAISHNKFLLVSSIYATCFGRADSPETFKNT